MNKAVFITGCSTGIGLQAVIDLANRDYTVFAGVRSSIDQEKLVQLAQTSNAKIISVICEVTDNESVRQAAITVKNKLQGKYLSGVINNAGIVFSGPLLHLSLADWETVFDVNVTGVLRVVQAFAPLLGLENRDQPKGRIINN